MSSESARNQNWTNAQERMGLEELPTMVTRPEVRHQIGAWSLRALKGFPIVKP